MRSLALSVSLTLLGLVVPSVALAQTGPSSSAGAGGGAGASGSAGGGVSASGSGSFGTMGTMGSGGTTSSAAPSNANAGGKGTSTTSATSTSTTSEMPGTQGTPESDSAREWAERDSQLSESTTLTGGVGLLRTQHAQGGAAGQFRVAFSTEYFSAGFLCTSNFPCKSPTGGAPVTSDGLDHIGGHLSLSANVTSWLEAYLGTSAVANSDTTNRPALLQVLGDSNIGVKAYGAVTKNKVLFLGGAMELWLLNGTGAVGLDGSGTSMKFRGLATADLRNLESKPPIRLSFNIGYMLDNSGDVLTATEQARGQAAGLSTSIPVTRIERFGLGVNRVDHLDMALGAEFFLAKEKVRPFIEYVIAVPVNRQGYQCVANNPSSDHCLANDALAPSTVSLGARFLPWKAGFSLLAALDIGVTGTNDFIEEMSPTPPWMLHIGAGWAYDTADRPPVIQTKTVEKIVNAAPPPRAKIVGFVHEDGKPQQAVANAIVTWDSSPSHTAFYTGADGHFTSEEVDAGSYTFGIRADGYRPGTCVVQIPAASRDDARLDCPIVALPKVGVIRGSVHDAQGGAPISTATIKVKDATQKDLSLGADGQGGFRFADVPPGQAQIIVEADGYLTAVQTVDVASQKEVTADITLVKRPKKSLVSVGAKEITIKQQIQFAVNSATILPESNQLLTEIADAIHRTPRIKKLEIQGHTDSTGTPDKNQTLSEERAESVRAWLVAHGIAGDRLVAHGYGQTKPLFPNVTTFNRTRNRRVQFVILEQE